MALVRKNPNAKPETESNPTTPAPAATSASASAQANAPAAAPVPAATPAAAPSTQTGLQVQVPRSVAVANLNAGHQFMDSLKDALRVDWDTLNRLKPGQGRFTWEQKNFGDWVAFRLISWQDNWLVSPGSDSDEAKQLAKYSDDGKFIKDTGEDINEYLSRLQNELGYEKARIGKRCVLAFELIDCDKDVEGIEEGMLFQMDLPPTSRASFDRYRIQAALDLGKGRVDGDGVIAIKATAVVKSQNQKDYTLVEFSRYKPKA